MAWYWYGHRRSWWYNKAIWSVARISGGYEGDKSTKNIVKVISTRIHAEGFSALKIWSGNQETKEERAIACTWMGTDFTESCCFPASYWFKTSSGMEKHEEKLVESVKGLRKVTRRPRPRWEELEDKLHLAFKETSRHGRSVNRKWFEKIKKNIFATIYPLQVGYNENHQVVFDCVFSDGWFSNFKKRWGISWRCKTSIASKTPEAHRQTIMLFCKFNQRNS